MLIWLIRESGFSLFRFQITTGENNYRISAIADTKLLIAGDDDAVGKIYWKN